MSVIDWPAIFTEALKWVRAYSELPEVLASKPDYQAAFALLSVLLHGHRSPPARVAAFKEYCLLAHGETKGVAAALADSDFDLSKLSFEEQDVLAKLLAKGSKSE